MNSTTIKHHFALQDSCNASSESLLLCCQDTLFMNGSKGILHAILNGVVIQTWNLGNNVKQLVACPESNNGQRVCILARTETQVWHLTLAKTILMGEKKRVMPCGTLQFLVKSRQAALPRKYNIWVRRRIDLFKRLKHSVYSRSFNIQDKTVSKHNNDKIMVYDTMVLIRSENTMQVYSSIVKKEKQTVSFQEFLLPSPVVHSVSFRDESVLYVGKNGRIYYISFLPKYQDKKHESIVSIDIIVSPLKKLEDVSRICTVDTSQYNKIVIAALQKNRTLTVAEIDSSSSEKLQSEQSDLRESIRQILKELSECENLAKEMDEEHQAVNEKLKDINSTLFSLQSIKQHKETSEAFKCEIRPILISRPVKEMMFSDMALRVRINVPLSMNWKKWQLHISLNDQKPLSQEMISIERGLQGSVQGKTLTTPLLGLDKLRKWEHDIPLPTNTLQFPLEVTASLSYSPMEQFLPTEKRIENLYSNNESPVVFSVYQMTIDDLHFAVPCSSEMISSIKSFGLWSVTERLQPVYFNHCLMDKSGNSLVTRLDTHCLRSNDKESTTEEQKRPKLIEDTTEIHFKVIAKDKEQSNFVYCKILYCLLQEGRTETILNEMLCGAEKALFTLASHSSFPVELSLSKKSTVINHGLDVTLKIKCYNSYVLFKVEAALLARISDRLVDPINAPPNKEFQEDMATFSKLHRTLLASYTKLESEFQKSSSDKDIWDALLVSLRHMREIHNNVFYVTLRYMVSHTSRIYV
ncbi:hypothetical protein PHYBLDRAFT_174486 [Phycomyces blakesleeanus NRRL 1555(-)]|uniref:Uncharacterized protein n=1 Tax=Phycomyces blakesleeanus (strain ATCC 8743b / DSM 1359 / FGSC 10004 / NBRC 33097 / NRRL 1555) TaxID=763407 RepID=A0A162ZIU3_PHYB8|nr:hypothetical protein PHYBLDRAFT_174486 [Phycomyces blakesleeanus NRRL 1555(-)]OAD67101.1 hypothetical protein PHYBLDRAFT_174486 [Phycomyces blakesleeanus NRRL 1555(-)]|eukprot:XP_018285141.1 hypothetical protein PHYBLDRAFT_174486 [Phycomyces blakesleeanus NRRL 1555(-)]